MSGVLVVLGFIGVLAVLVARALLVDEITGRIRRRVQARLERTIIALPDELQAEWADEWRAEFAAVITMPLSAARFVHGVRTSARELVADPALAPAGVHGQPGTAEGVRRALHDARGRVARFAAGLAAISRLAVVRDQRELLRAAASLVASAAAAGLAVHAVPAAVAAVAAVSAAIAIAIAIAAMAKWRLR